MKWRAEVDLPSFLVVDFRPSMEWSFWDKVRLRAVPCTSAVGYLMFVRLRNLIMSPLPTVKPFNICLILSFHVRCWKDARIVVWIFRIITLARNKMLRTESCISTRTPQRAIGLPPIDSSNPSLSPNKVFWKTIKFHSPWTITVSAAMTINC